MMAGVDTPAAAGHRGLGKQGHTGMITQRDVERSGTRLKGIAEAVMSVITSLPPEVQGRCVKQSARLIGIMVKLDTMMAGTEDETSKTKGGE